MNLDEYSCYDGVGLAQLVRKGDVTPSELAVLALSGVQIVNPDLNVMAEEYTDRPDPKFSDQLPDGPFKGVPMLNKDLSAAEAGCLEEMGSPMGKGLRNQEDSLVFSRYRKAGFLNLGRTTTAEFGLLGITENRLTGITRNPWSTDRTPGGSSGGSAAAVAAGIVPIASGGDAGGSIRVPAAYCGLVGLKPTRGRISQGSNRVDAYVGISTPFALMRSLRDMASMLDVLSGHHSSDPYRIAQNGTPFTQELGVKSKPLKVAVWPKSWYGYPVEAPITKSMNATVDFLRSEGHCIVEDTPRFDYQEFLDAALTIWCAGLFHSLERLSKQVGKSVSPDTVLNSTYIMYEHGRNITANEYIKGLSVFQKVTHAVGAFFESYDLLVLPTTPKPAPLVGYYDADPADGTDLYEWHNSLYNNDAFAGVFNASGNPALSLPLHQTDNELPIGIQFVADVGNEALLIRLGHQLEKAFPWADRRPLVHVANKAASDSDRALPKERIRL